MNKIRYLTLLAAMLSLLSAAAQGSITVREGWLDDNYQNRQQLPPGQATFNIGNMPEGMHSFSIQVVDDKGNRSPAQTMLFVKPIETSQATGISLREAWIDGYFEKRQPISGSPASLDITKLNPGLHSLTTHVRDNNWKYSPAVTSLFVKTIQGSIATNITKTIAWIDGKNDRPQTLNPQQAVIDITSLGKGIHLLTVQAYDDLGRTSAALSQFFLIPTDTPESAATGIDMCHYWFNDSSQNAQYAPLEAVSGIVALDISHLRQGEHILYWQVRDNNGNWSPTLAQTFNLRISEYTLGDINNDGFVDVADLNILINVLLGKDQASNYGHRCYITDDETIDIADLNVIINTMLGK